MPVMKSAAPTKPIKPIVAKPVIARPNIVQGKPAPRQQSYIPGFTASEPKIPALYGNNPFPPPFAPRPLSSFSAVGQGPSAPPPAVPGVPIGRGGTAPWVTNLQNALYNKVMPPIQRKVAEAQRAGQAWWGDLTGGTLGR